MTVLKVVENKFKEQQEELLRKEAAKLIPSQPQPVDTEKLQPTIEPSNSEHHTGDAAQRTHLSTPALVTEEHHPGSMMSC